MALYQADAELRDSMGFVQEKMEEDDQLWNKYEISFSKKG